VDRVKTRISIPWAQAGGRALVLKTAGLAIDRRVAPPDRRNGSFEVGTLGDDEIE
jgi:hypothetical protein